MKKVSPFWSGLLAVAGANIANLLMTGDKSVVSDPAKLESQATQIISDNCPYLIKEDNPEKTYAVIASPTIGRFSYNDIAIPNDRSVSRIHCKIFMHDGNYYIVDLGAKLRTKVNGKDIPLYNAKDEKELYKCKLKHRDSIKIGKSNYIFCVKEDKKIQNLYGHNCNTTTVIE